MAGLTFLFTQSIGSKYLGQVWGAQNPWINSSLRQYLSGEFLNSFPSQVKSSLISVKKVTGLWARDAEELNQTVETNDTAFILSTQEYTSVRKTGVLGVGKDHNEQYLLSQARGYTALGIRNAWLRDTSNYHGAAAIGTDGNLKDATDSGNNQGVRDTFPCFCL